MDSVLENNIKTFLENLQLLSFIVSSHIDKKNLPTKMYWHMLEYRIISVRLKESTLIGQS